MEHGWSSAFDLTLHWNICQSHYPVYPTFIAHPLKWDSWICVILMKMCSFSCMWLDSCSPECCRECQEVTQAEETWVAWLSEDGDETGQLYRSGARCSIRLDLNIALENRSCLPIPLRLCGTPAQSYFLILGNTVQLCSLGWPNIQLLELDHILLLYFTWLW